jgi:SAM-dependent methyltransferase
VIAALQPHRRRGLEVLDDPGIDPVARERSHRDLVRANRLLGGRRAVLLALRPVLDDLARAHHAATLLDVGTGLADIPWRAREAARRRGIALHTVGLDGAPSLVAAARPRLDDAVGGGALALPFADDSIDIVVCSQLLHHFEEQDALRLLAELDRVARRCVIVSDVRRSWLAAAGFWIASVALRFDPITRHDGTTSVLRGFTALELRDMVLHATGVQPVVRRRLGYRLTACWTPTTSAA